MWWSADVAYVGSGRKLKCIHDFDHEGWRNDSLVRHGSVGQYNIEMDNKEIE